MKNDFIKSRTAGLFKICLNLLSISFAAMLASSFFASFPLRIRIVLALGLLLLLFLAVAFASDKEE
jgi:hypothetical protein